MGSTGHFLSPPHPSAKSSGDTMFGSIRERFWSRFKPELLILRITVAAAVERTFSLLEMYFYQQAMRNRVFIKMNEPVFVCFIPLYTSEHKRMEKKPKALIGTSVGCKAMIWVVKYKYIHKFPFFI